MEVQCNAFEVQRTLTVIMSYEDCNLHEATEGQSKNGQMIEHWNA
jgi:hypothetical protein